MLFLIALATWYGLCLAHVAWVASSASVSLEAAQWVLVFGHASPGGALSASFQKRLNRALVLHEQFPGATWIVMGGRANSQGFSEAELGIGYLASRSEGMKCLAEPSSVTTLDNVRKAKNLLTVANSTGNVWLLSERYHLARCSLLARREGIPHRVCAAEEKLAWNWTTLRHMGLEAGYLLISSASLKLATSAIQWRNRGLRVK